jgi:hypothetical protein
MDGNGCTLIDAYDLDANELRVRGKSLLELAGELSYLQLVFFAMTGRRFVVRTVERLVAIAKKAARDRYDLVRVERPAATAQELIASVAQVVMRARVREDLPEPPLPAQLSADEWAGCVLLQAIPDIVVGRLCAKSLRQAERAEGRRSSGSGYAADVLKAFLPAEGDADVIKRWPPDKLMASLVGGFGVVAPTTALARFSASTLAPLEWCAAASAMGCGPAHLGACSLAMDRLREARLGASSERNLFHAYCARMPFPGFGHPIMLSDPRSDFLFDAFAGCKPVDKARRLAKSITEAYGIRPNIDFVAAAVLASYGVPPAGGSLFFWLCRLPIIVAHICEKRSQPPFGLRSSDARELYRKLPRAWL